jgi:hypothetical protein
LFFLIVTLAADGRTYIHIYMYTVGQADRQTDRKADTDGEK